VILINVNHFHNIDLISQNAERRASSFRISSKNIIKKNNPVVELFLRTKHAFGGGQSHKENLRRLLTSNVEALNHESATAFIHPETSACTELFIASQRYNQANQNKTRLFRELSLNHSITNETCPQLAPISLKINEIRSQVLENIPKSQKPYISKNCLFSRKYHYNYADSKISHVREALRIFLSTQRERLISLIGRIIEKVAAFFGKNISVFPHSHYFRNREDKTGEIYSHDSPLSATGTPTSYWIGHATTCMNIPLETQVEGRRIHINMITDPVEGDLNKLLYPRMTKTAKPIENCPIPHVYMLSHNHGDHFQKSTLQKLCKHQPIMLVPEGDMNKFKKLGFKHVYQNEWWQTITIPIKQSDLQAELKISTVPAHHWSGGQSLFMGYVIHQKEGDIYFAGDTARLSEEHVETLRKRFAIRSMFQPGGPDEVRKDMESTHQASVDGLWMHFNLMIRNLYDKENFSEKSKQDFMVEAKKLRTIFMHTKTYKLGNLHFDDTDKSVERVKNALRSGVESEEMKSYETVVYHELLSIGKRLQFQDGSRLNASDIIEILDEGIIIPKIGSRTELAS
jgi:L-ascorbate metabolism protein UlaG (beta-lactamase superfamily)